MNNLEYQAALKERSFKGDLMTKGVRHVAQHAFWERPGIVSGLHDSYSMSFWSHLYESKSDCVVLRRADEVYRSRRYFDGRHETVFVIWRIRHGE